MDAKTPPMAMEPNGDSNRVLVTAEQVGQIPLHPENSEEEEVCVGPGGGWGGLLFQQSGLVQEVGSGKASFLVPALREVSFGIDSPEQLVRLCCF
jgi:hypothetical protein